MRVDTIQLFDLAKPLPFMQGEAIRAVVKNLGGKLLAAGQVTGGVGLPAEGYLLYMKSAKKNVQESIWLDDGLSLTCMFYKLDGGSGQDSAHLNGAWVRSTLNKTIPHLESVAV